MISKLDFSVAPDILHFNHAGIAPWPKTTAVAVINFAKENASGKIHAAQWDQRTTLIRKLLAQLIGAESHRTIALTKNTSEGLSLVAGGIDWQPGDNVVVGNLEFPSNRLVWESLAERFSVKVQLADFSGGDYENSLLACMNKNTRLLAVSSIQYTTGYRINLKQLGEQCKKNNTLFCVDAIQSLGVVPFNVQDCLIDFVCADGHKWLMSPEGTGIFYCREALIPTLKLQQFGWHMTTKPEQYENTQWQAAQSAQRFECGSMNHLGLAGLAASLELFADIGMENIYRKIIRKLSYLIDNIDKRAYTILTPSALDQRGGIVTIQHKHISNDSLFQQLKQRQVLCAQRAGGIRLSPHFYTPQEDLDRLLDYLHQA